MKLNKSQTQEIANHYSLGKIISIKLIPVGLINYNFDLKTEKGEYILQVIGKNPRSMKDRFKILNYLSKKEFPYEIPVPLQNKNKKYLSKLENNYLWVYKKIKGVTHNNSNLSEYKQLAKALAIYHKKIKPLEGKTESIHGKLKENLRLLKNLKPKSNIENLLIENREIFYKLFDQISKLKLGEMIWRHNDMHENNLVFRKGKVVGIIDFGNSRYSTLAGDIAVAIKRTRYKKPIKQKINEFLKEYKKYNKITKRTEENIIKEMCSIHVGETMWLYRGLEKNPQDKLKYLKGAIKGAKELMTLLK